MLYCGRGKTILSAREMANWNNREMLRIFFSKFRFNLFSVQASAWVEKERTHLKQGLWNIAFELLLCFHVLGMMIYMAAREFATEYVNICINIMRFVFITCICRISVVYTWVLMFGQSGTHAKRIVSYNLFRKHFTQQTLNMLI